MLRCRDAAAWYAELDQLVTNAERARFTELTVQLRFTRVVRTADNGYGSPLADQVGNPINSTILSRKPVSCGS